VSDGLPLLAIPSSRRSGTGESGFVVPI
jgi:hypothetical protein